MMTTRLRNGDVVLILESPPGVTHPELIGRLGVVEHAASCRVRHAAREYPRRGVWARWAYYRHQLEIVGDVRPIGDTP